MKEPPPQQIELHNEELVLHGFAHADRHAIGAPLQQNLQVFLAERGVLEVWRAGAERIHACQIQPERGATPAQVGQQLACPVIEPPKQ